MGTMTPMALLCRLDELTRAEQGLGQVQSATATTTTLEPLGWFPTSFVSLPFSPGSQPTSPHLRPCSHPPTQLSFPLKAVPVPGTIRLSGQYPLPRTPSREDRTVSSVRAVSPGWVHNRCSACVWGWMRGWTHWDVKDDAHVTHSLTRAPERSLSGILSSPATRRPPQLRGGLWTVSAWLAENASCGRSQRCPSTRPRSAPRTRRTHSCACPRARPFPLPHRPSDVHTASQETAKNELI